MNLKKIHQGSKVFCSTQVIKICFSISLPGQDHQEDRVAYGVLQVQEEDPVPHQEDQALRVGWRQEEEGTDDPVLSETDSSLFFLYSTLKKVILFYMGRKI